MKPVEKLIWLNDFIMVLERDKQSLKRWNVVDEGSLPVLFARFDAIIEDLMKDLNDLRRQVNTVEGRDEPALELDK